MRDINLIKRTSIFIVFLFSAFGIYALYSGSEVKTYFSYTYSIIALFASLVGFYASKKWGGYSSVLGRSIFMFSLGLLCQFIGQLSYTIYDYYLGVNIPYPSFGDFGWFMTIPFYFYGSFLVGKASGINFKINTLKARILALVIPCIMLVFSYWLFLREYVFDWNSVLKVFFDFGYPLGHALYISMALTSFIFTYKLLGGIMRPVMISILLAMMFQYFGDFSFLYSVITTSFYWGGLYDYFFLISYSIMLFTLIKVVILADNFVKNKI